MDVSFNPLNKLNDGVFDGLINLQTLNLSHTNLVHIDFGIISPLINMRLLNISNSQLKKVDIGPHSIIFHNLNRIYLKDNQIKEIIGLTNETLPELNELNLRGNLLNCSYLKFILNDFNLRRLKLLAYSSSKMKANRSYRGVACLPIKIGSSSATAKSIVKTTSIDGNLSNVFAENDRFLEYPLHQRLDKMNMLMTLMVIVIIVAISVKIVFKYQKWILRTVFRRKSSIRVVQCSLQDNKESESIVII